MGPKKRKKRNPNDATFRNINSLKRRVGTLEEFVAYLSDIVAQLGVEMLMKPRRTGKDK